MACGRTPAEQMEKVEMKIVNWNDGTYRKVTGKKDDGDMSVEMFDWIVALLGGNKKSTQIGIITKEHLAAWREDKTFAELEKTWNNKQYLKQVS
jgi:hypothetical protein